MEVAGQDCRLGTGDNEREGIGHGQGLQFPTRAASFQVLFTSLLGRLTSPPYIYRSLEKFRMSIVKCSMLIARDENITDRGSLLDCNFRLWTIFEARSQCLTRLSHYTRVDLNSSCSFVLQPQIEGVRGAFGNDSSSQPADGFLAKALTRCPTESKPLPDKNLSFRNNHLLRGGFGS